MPAYNEKGQYIDKSGKVVKGHNPGYMARIASLFETYGKGVGDEIELVLTRLETEMQRRELDEADNKKYRKKRGLNPVAQRY